MRKYLLRNVSSGIVNLPPEIWKEAGWSINDEVELVVADCEDHNGVSFKSISIDRVKDIENLDFSLEEEEK